MRWKAALAIGLITLLVAGVIFGPTAPQDPFAGIRQFQTKRDVTYSREPDPHGHLQFVQNEKAEFRGLSREEFQNKCDLGLVLFTAPPGWYTTSKGRTSITYDSVFANRGVEVSASTALTPREVLWVRMTNLGRDPFK